MFVSLSGMVIVIGAAWHGSLVSYGSYGSGWVYSCRDGFEKSLQRGIGSCIVTIFDWTKLGIKEAGYVSSADIIVQAEAVRHNPGSVASAIPLCTRALKSGVAG